MFQGTGVLAFNAAFYLQQNPDVFQAIQTGAFQGSALDHFTQFGQFEGRDPNQFFDTEYYLAENPDVLTAIADPAVPSVTSAFQHFVTFGFAEGEVRAPSAQFEGFNAPTYLAQNPDLQEAFGDLEGEALEDALFAHFVQFGVNENRPGSGVDATEPGFGGGQTFTLTDDSNIQTGGVDTITGTAGNDLIRAIAGESLGSEDTINGGAGVDTLTIADNAFADNAAPVIRNVEIINNANAGILNLTSVSGLQQVNSVAGATFNNASTATVFGLTTAGTLTIDYAGALAGATTANVAATLGASGIATFEFGADAAAIENVVVTTAGTGTTTVVLDDDLDALETITVNASNATVITSDETTIETFDASGSTAGVTFVSDELAQNATITGGAGNDVLDFSAVDDADVDLTINGGAGNDIITGGAGDDTINGGAGNDILDGGAGNDTINGGAGNDIINGGAGADILTGGAGNDVFVYAAADSAGTTRTTIDIITDFNTSGNDTIDVSATALTGFVNAVDAIAVQNAVDGAAAGSTLAQVVALVDGVTDDGEVASFQFGGNTYVYGDTTAADTDLLIELTGVVAVTADDFIF